MEIYRLAIDMSRVKTVSSESSSAEIEESLSSTDSELSGASRSTRWEEILRFRWISY